jgi:hypothetical protein
MRIDPDVTAFLASPVMIIVGTGSEGGYPAIGRAVGARVDGGDGAIELVVSAWQWPTTTANVRANGRVAVTFARPSDYVSYQVKGAATLRTADAADLALSERYMTDIVAALAPLGLEPRLVAPSLTNRDAVVVLLTADAIFVQTPGKKAGRPLEPRG